MKPSSIGLAGRSSKRRTAATPPTASWSGWRPGRSRRAGPRPPRRGRRRRRRPAHGEVRAAGATAYRFGSFATTSPRSARRRSARLEPGDRRHLGLRRPRERSFARCGSRGDCRLGDHRGRARARRPPGRRRRGPGDPLVPLSSCRACSASASCSPTCGRGSRGGGRAGEIRLRGELPDLSQTIYTATTVACERGGDTDWP